MGLVLLASCASAVEPGVGAAAFLRRGVDARALGMGGAHVAVADGYSSMYWNPAGLARAESPQAGGMTTELYGAEIFLNYLAGVYPWELGRAEQTPSHTAGDEPGVRLALGASFTEMATEVRAYDERGNPIGLIRYSEALYSLGAAGWVPGLGYAGGVVKAYRFLAPQAGVEGVDATAFGIGFDAGLAAPVWRGLWLGISASDIADSSIQWRNTPQEPTDLVAGRYAAGAAYDASELFWDDDRLVVAADLSLEPLVENRVLRGGVEYSLGFLSLRGGASFRMGEEFEQMLPSYSAGVGVRMLQLGIDAAWVQNRELDPDDPAHTWVVSAVFRF